MKITIDSNLGTFDFECAATERILHAGLTHGLALPYECATGTCGTCRGRVVAGSVHVEWNEAPGFAKLRREKGDVLMCQARPTSDCTLRVPAKIVPHANPETLPAHRTARIANVRRLVRDVLDFELVLSQPMTFDAGQFVVLEREGIAGGRAYSMVNFDRNTGRLKLVVKQMAGGRFSEWLFGGDPTGAELAVFGPLGRGFSFRLRRPAWPRSPPRSRAWSSRRARCPDRSTSSSPQWKPTTMGRPSPAAWTWSREPSARSPASAIRPTPSAG